MAGGVASVTSATTRRLELAAFVPGITAFGAVAWIGFANGGYFPSEWGWAALGFALLALLALLSRERVAIAPLEIAAVLALGAFASWTLLSVLWSPSSAQPVLAFERTSVYVLALVAVLLVSTRRGSASSLVGGVLAAIAVLSGYGLSTYVHGTRLSEPVGYSNGVGVLAVVGLLVALGLAANVVDRRARAIAFGAVPLLSAALYLTFSRGSWLALVAGVAVSFLVDEQRPRLLAVVALAAPAAALCIVSAGAGATGSRLDIAVLAWSVVALGIGWALPRLEERARVLARGRRVLGALVVLGVVTVIIGAVEAQRSFSRHPPTDGSGLERRLFSASSNGRADYWRVATTEVDDHPLLGGGAGSFPRYWELLRPSALGAQNAHNLYLETLAELGPVGLALLLAAFGVPFVAVRKARGSPAATAATAAFAAFVVHAAVDWDFQLLAVSLAALVCAAAVLVSAREREPVLLRSGGRWLGICALATIGVLAIVAQVGNSALAHSRAALDRDDTARAVRLARQAERWQPWSYEPRQVLAEAQLADGQLAAARAGIRRALALDRSNASLWLDLAASSSGRARSNALAEATQLDPRAPAWGSDDLAPEPIPSSGSD
jgi:O-antigen ligase